MRQQNGPGFPDPEPQLPCKCGNADPSLFARVGGERACLVCAYAERRGEEIPVGRRRVLAREARQVASGEYLPAGPFAAWLRQAEVRYPWALLIEWSGWHDKALREVREGDRRVVPTDVVDRLLLWWPPADTRLDDLYDLAGIGWAA